MARNNDFDFPSNNALTGVGSPTNLPWLQWFQRIHSIVGVRQIWTDVLASRALGVPYVNGTGRPIKINIGASSTASARLDVTFLSGVQIGGQGQANIGTNMSIYAEIPNGETYTVTVNSGVGTLSQWVELR